MFSSFFFFLRGGSMKLLVVMLETSKLPPLNSVVPTEEPHADNDEQCYQS
jgi:hypothetical protein